MRNTKLLLAIATSAALLTGCQNTHGIDTNMAISSGLNAYKAATLSDADAKAIANQGCAEMDSGNQVASKSSKYGKRLAKIAKALGNNINGTPVNYKVYMTSDVNAWAMANGCVRVYSGLMDMMNDNEIEGVLGHELGHVALGHSLAEMKASMRSLPHAMPFQLPAVWLPSFPAHNWVISQKALSMLNTPVIKSPKQMISPLIC
ncbi:peptidase%2C M48B family [Escherichia coli]|nr:peptidase%2C M48B family [Escherichia coli]CTX26868.1 peptidase%2C M48B family [Escherichia coli]